MPHTHEYAEFGTDSHNKTPEKNCDSETCLEKYLGQYDLRGQGTSQIEALSPWLSVYIKYVKR